MQLSNIEPSSVTYGILIKAYGFANQLDNAFNAFIKMKESNLQPNDVTYGCLLDACIKNRKLDKALTVFEDMKKDNIVMNSIIYTTLIKGYAQSYKLDEALKLYEEMKQNKQIAPTNVITFNSLIDCCVRCNNSAKAVEIFTEMKERKVSPDLITFSTLIKGFCKERNMEAAFKVQ